MTQRALFGVPLLTPAQKQFLKDSEAPNAQAFELTHPQNVNDGGSVDTWKYLTDPVNGGGIPLLYEGIVLMITVGVFALIWTR